MMAIVPPISIGAVLYGRTLRTISKDTTDASANLTKLAEERISNIRTVRAFSQESREIVSYQNSAKRVLDLGMKEAYASGIFFGAVSTCLSRLALLEI